jgi:hypothetical protein
MAEAKVLSGAGLRGQVAGQTELCTVGKTGAGLTYRGYDVRDLAAQCCFEEVAYLLLYGELPNKAQLDAYQAKLQGLRDLPQALKEVLERIPASAHPMDVMRTGASMLGNLEPEEDFSQQRDKADRLLGALPAIMVYWYRFSHQGERIACVTEEPTIGGHFLALLHGKKPSELHVKVMNVSLILYAEHEFNASTFTARVCASTLSDLFSCVTGAIGSLRGPLHGGANEAAMELIWFPRGRPRSAAQQGHQRLRVTDAEDPVGGGVVGIGDLDPDERPDPGAVQQVGGRVELGAQRDLLALPRHDLDAPDVAQRQPGGTDLQLAVGHPHPRAAEPPQGRHEDRHRDRVTDPGADPGVAHMHFGAE